MGVTALARRLSSTNGMVHSVKGECDTLICFVFWILCVSPALLAFEAGEGDCFL